MSAHSERRLLQRVQVLDLLQLADEKIQQLIDTRQLVELRICGEARFDSRDVDRLIEAYRNVQSKRRYQ